MSKRQSRKMTFIAATSAVVGFIGYKLYSKKVFGSNRHKSDHDQTIWSESKEEHNSSNNEQSMIDTLNEPAAALPDNCSWITCSELISILENKSKAYNNNDYVTIDVRDKNVDFKGGHITKSINISDQEFESEIQNLLKRYSSKKMVILCDMYGRRRSVKCANYYCHALKQIIANYDVSSQKTFYYKLQTKPNDSFIIDEKKMLNLTGELDDQKIELDGLVDADAMDGFAKQKVFVLQEGYHKWINVISGVTYNNLHASSQFIDRYDSEHWELLNLKGLINKALYYHKNEYFFANRFAQLKQRCKSKHFQRNSKF